MKVVDLRWFRAWRRIVHAEPRKKILHFDREVARERLPDLLGTKFYLRVDVGIFPRFLDPNNLFATKEEAVSHIRDSENVYECTLTSQYIEGPNIWSNKPYEENPWK